jgi:hypothetical protein
MSLLPRLLSRGEKLKDLLSGLLLCWFSLMGLKSKKAGFSFRMKLLTKNHRP